MTKIIDLKNEILIFDGAMGTMIQKTDVLKPGHAPELLNLSHPEVIVSIHKSYLQAGSRCIETNTFGGTRLKLGSHDITGDKVREVNFAAVMIAKEAAQTKSDSLIAASVGPTGRMIEPLGDLSFEDALEAFREQCLFLAQAGADLINIETMSDIHETKAAILAALSVNLPVMASVSFMENGRLLTGYTPEMVAATLSGFPLLALGTNCGQSAGLLIPIVKKLISYSQRFVIVQPNAGKPTLSDNQTMYMEPPTEFANSCLELVKMGVRAIGGCCGTSPEHIKLIKNLITQANIPYHQEETGDFLVGKSTLIPVDLARKNEEIWKLPLNLANELWAELINGNDEPLIDQLFEQDPVQIKQLELDGLELTEKDEKHFLKLIQVLSTYWPNPIAAKLQSDSLIKVLLKNNPGRSLVMTNMADPILLKTIAEYGGIFQPIQ